MQNSSKCILCNLYFQHLKKRDSQRSGSGLRLGLRQNLMGFIMRFRSIFRENEMLRVL
jgi:hypothetical protein